MSKNLRDRIALACESSLLPRALCLSIFLLLILVNVALTQDTGVVQLTEKQNKKVSDHLTKAQRWARDHPGPVDPRVKAVSNGCGPSWLPGLDNLADKRTFRVMENGKEIRYDVYFRPACDMHDAGYAGLLIQDILAPPGATVDYTTADRIEVDNKFRVNLEKICDNTITADHVEARAMCKGPQLGAEFYFNAVRKVGKTTFDCNLTTGGVPWNKPCTRNND